MKSPEVVPHAWDLHLYKKTAPHVLSGVLQLADELDVRILLCNSPIPFFGKDVIPMPEVDKCLFSELDLPHHVKSQWLSSCSQSLSAKSQVKFSYMLGDQTIKVKLGVMADEPGCLWYYAKSKRYTLINPMDNLRESDLRLAMDLMPSLVWCSKGSNVIYGNRMWLDYGGEGVTSKMDEEAVKSHWSNICHFDDFNWVCEKWQLVAHKGEPFEGQVRLKKDDDDYRWFKIVAAPIQEGGIGEHKWVGVCTDIHDQKLQETQAIVDKAISNFLAMMSHEMRTPLTGITGLLQWLTGTSLSPEQLDCCSTISICTDSLLVMINNLLDIMKLEGGQVELVCNDINPVKITEICVDMFSRLSEPKKIEMIYNIDLAMPDLVISDNNRYQQVLTNLLSNAVKFTREGGEIEVSLQVISESEAMNFVKEPKHDLIKSQFDKVQWLQFSVRDTGRGIEKEKMPNIFRRFSQVEASLTSGSQGGGLGLAICRNIATLMNGAVTAISEPDKGSQFFFTVPVGVSPNANPLFGPRPSLSPISPPPPSPCSVVLVRNLTLYTNFVKKLANYKFNVITLEEYKSRVGDFPTDSLSRFYSIPGSGIGSGIGSTTSISGNPFSISGMQTWARGGRGRRLSSKGSWSDLSTILEVHEERGKKKEEKQKRKEKRKEDGKEKENEDDNDEGEEDGKKIENAEMDGKREEEGKMDGKREEQREMDGHKKGKGLKREDEEKEMGSKQLRKSKSEGSVLGKTAEEREKEKEKEKVKEKEEEKEKEEDKKANACIVFVDQTLWLEIESETREWLKKNTEICVVRMGYKDMLYEEGTRSLIKPVKDHMLYAECDIFLRSCELPKQTFVPSELSRSRDASLESLGIQFPLRVMVADDSTVNLQVASKLLQKIGYKTISTCINGTLVLQHFSTQGPVEVVLMDMQMPGLDGCETTILLRQQYPNTVIHIIGFTATSFSEDRVKCLSSGMCSFLSKPVKLSELEAEIIKAWRAVNLRIPCSCNKHLKLSNKT